VCRSVTLNHDSLEALHTKKLEPDELPHLATKQSLIGDRKSKPGEIE
jgi:hypothetical protein